jgi:2'-5' RNA ligase
MKKRAIVYWLLPAKNERELFCEIVRILCRELNAPNFEPHLTLFVSKETGQSPKRILQEFKSLPIRLRVRGVAFSPKYTKTLFVRFKSSNALKKLTVDLGKALKTRATVPSDPHLSLLYKKRISAATEKELAATLKLPFREVVFDSVAAVRLTLPVRTRADVKVWRIVARKSLRR